MIDRWDKTKREISLFCSFPFFFLSSPFLLESVYISRLIFISFFFDLLSFERGTGERSVHIFSPLLVPPLFFISKHSTTRKIKPNSTSPKDFREREGEGGKENINQNQEPKKSPRKRRKKIKEI
jgi:hypothetical protein